MDIVKELTRLHELAGETTLLNFRALMQSEIRKLIEGIQEQVADDGWCRCKEPLPDEYLDEAYFCSVCHRHRR